MDSIIAQVQTLAAKSDEEGRNKILNSLRDVQNEIETPMDAFFKIYNSHVQVAVIYVAVELGLFNELAKEKGSMLTVDELAVRSGASPALLERLLRYLSSTGFMENVGPNQFQANKTSSILADPMALAGVHHCFDSCGPAVQALPSFLAENNYQDITDNKNTPFQKGFTTKLTCFEWLPQQPKLFAAMQKVMTRMQSSEWIKGFALLDKEAGVVELKQKDVSEKPFLVDVGGGHGHQCVQLLKQYPNLHGHLVLEDLPQALDKLPPIDGVEIVTQDFFEKQTIQGAKFYYLRRIMHDWPDDLCIKILQNLAAAMNSESRILIDEVVLPDVNAHWHATMSDITMGILFGGRERTRFEWEALVEKSGLHLAQIHTYNVSLYNSIIVLELK